MADFLNIFAIGVLLGGIYALVSVGLNLIFGVIRVVNFAQGEFVMLGMYGTFAAYTALGLDPYLGVAVVVPALFVLGMAVQRFLLTPLRAEPAIISTSCLSAASSSTPTPRMMAGKNRSSEKTRLAVSGRISAIDSVRWVTRLRAAWLGT